MEKIEKILENKNYDALTNNIIDYIDKSPKLELIEKLQLGFKYILQITIIIILIISFYRNTKWKNIPISESIKFMKKCFEGILLNHNPMKYTHNCKISVVIPVYNCEKTIKPVIRSIQNQDMADIEIILVNDNSKDNTSQIIKELMEEDRRIRIINNENNKGTLCSRNIGIMTSIGEYIMNLDNDDLFMDQTVFNATYNEAKEGNFDIIEFYAYDILSYNPKESEVTIDHFHNKKAGLIVRKPNLLYFPISYNNNTFSPNDYHVWGRLVKSNLYKKAINNFGFTASGVERATDFVCWTEDIDITIPLFSFAESFKFIGKNGIFHYISQQTASFLIPREGRIYDEIFLVDVIFDFTENNEKGKKLASTRVDKLKNDYCNYFKNSEKNVKLLKAVLNKISNCQFISEEDKNYLINGFKTCGVNT